MFREAHERARGLGAAAPRGVGGLETARLKPNSGSCVSQYLRKPRNTTRLGTGGCRAQIVSRQHDVTLVTPV